MRWTNFEVINFLRDTNVDLQEMAFDGKLGVNMSKRINETDTKNHSYFCESVTPLFLKIKVIFFMIGFL